ncbi:hypothetical protein N7517_000608 [Penicillium concentricum]|uniref:Lysine-specific metallo-endopeptidase domain-containing protein n=1 Tax=Penicillium concentricum TaxID=293559 RepID=A0A9W9SQK7_9EURO|nr:uncharacterized protein N7517_000608 [Penicillium concentricum]KAJ5382697.1 hypothetical protein N7517_000608 [Penicillium concentricum]
MIFGRSGTTMLVTLGQILLLADVLQCAQGLLIVPDRIFENNRSSVAEKRDGSQAGDSDWVKITGWETFLLHTATCAGLNDESDAMSITKRDSDTVTDTTKAMFADVLDDVLEINRGALDAIPTLESAWDKMSNREELSAEEKTQINFYMAMYGTFKETDSTGMDRANRRIAQLKYFANQFVEGLDKDSFKIRIICDESAWELIDYHGEGNVCQNDKGKQATLAFMMEGDEGDDGHDYMTICPLGWERFAEAVPIPVSKVKSLESLEYQHIDDVAKSPADGVFTHELTHSKYFWGALKTGDIALNDGKKAYGFENVVTLAKEGNNEDDVSQLRALKNADTYKYWATGE